MAKVFVEQPRLYRVCLKTVSFNLAHKRRLSKPKLEKLLTRYSRKEIEQKTLKLRRVFLADPGKARGCSTNIIVIHLFIH